MQVKSASHRNAERRRQLEALLSTPAVGWLSTEVAHSYKCLHSTKISLCLRPSQLHILTCHHSSVKLYHFGECLWIRELHQPHVSQNWQKKCLVLPASDHDRIFIFCYYPKQVVAWHLAKLCQGPGQNDQDLNAVSHYIQVIIIRWRNDIWPVRGKPAKKSPADTKERPRREKQRQEREAFRGRSKGNQSDTIFFFYAQNRARTISPRGYQT